MIGMHFALFLAGIKKFDLDGMRFFVCTTSTSMYTKTVYLPCFDMMLFFVQLQLLNNYNIQNYYYYFFLLHFTMAIRLHQLNIKPTPNRLQIHTINLKQSQ